MVFTTTCSVASDQALEQTIHREGKSHGGVFGSTLRKGALTRWLATIYITAEYIEAFKEMVAEWVGKRWPSGLERWLGLATGRPRPGSNPTSENVSLRNFGNSVYPALPVSFEGDPKSHRSLLYGAYARGSKI